MKGQNKLVLNEATMIEALNYYLNRWASPPGQVEVYGVAQKEKITPEFEVLLREPKKDAADQ